MTQRWISLLVIMLIEYYSAKRCAQIQFMKLQIELLWTRLDRSHVILFSRGAGADAAGWCRDES